MISYVLDDSHVCGGHRVVFEHVHGLVERGHEAQLLYRTGTHAWFEHQIPAKRFRNPQELKSVRGIKVATWCGTAPWVAQSLYAEDQGFYLVQGLDEETILRRKSCITYGMGLTHLTTSRWLRGQLKIRWNVDAALVGIGTAYRRVEVPAPDQNELFGQPLLMPYNMKRNKGWQTSEETMQRIEASLAAGDEVAFFAFGLEKRRANTMIDKYVLRPTIQRLSELYSSARCFLFTSTHEGFGLPPLEAMASACPVVCTPADGNEEYCIDGETALVRDNANDLAAACLDVIFNNELHDKLSRNGLAMAERYRWPNVIDRLEQVYGLK